MSDATPDQREQVERAIHAASAPFAGTVQWTANEAEELRQRVYTELYMLAIKRVIPPEIRLDVEATLTMEGDVKLGFTADLLLWLYAGDSARMAEFVRLAAAARD